MDVAYHGHFLLVPALCEHEQKADGDGLVGRLCGMCVDRHVTLYDRETIPNGIVSADECRASGLYGQHDGKEKGTA